MLDWRRRGRGFEPRRRHCVVSLSKNINSNLVLVQPRKTHPFINERLLMGRKESNLTNSRRAVVSYKRKFVHKALVNHRVKACPGKRVVRLADHLDMTIAVEWDREPQAIQKGIWAST